MEPSNTDQQDLPITKENQNLSNQTVSNIFSFSFLLYVRSKSQPVNGLFHYY